MDSVHLHGAEDVRRAGSAMQDAASTMNSAANTICESNDRLMRALYECIGRLEDLERKRERIETIVNEPDHAAILGVKP